MKRIHVLLAAAQVLNGCGMLGPPKPDAIPAALVPPGFTAADCHWLRPYAPHEPET
jgi:hypothetical protein